MPRLARVLTIAVLVAIWAAWSALPPRPSATWRETISFTNVELAPGGRRILVRFDETLPRYMSLREPETGREVFATEFLHADAWAPDGEWFAFQQRDGTIRVVDADDGRERFAIAAERGEIGPVGLFASPDGRRLAIARDRRDRPRIEIRDVVDGRVVLEIAHARGPVAFSPDGRVLATHGTADEAFVKLRDAEDGRTLGEMLGRAESFAFSPDSRTLAAVIVDSDGHFRTSIWDVPAALPRDTLPDRWKAEDVNFPKGFGPRFRPDGLRLSAHLRVWDLEHGGPPTFLTTGDGLWSDRHLRRGGNLRFVAQTAWDAAGEPFPLVHDVAISEGAAFLALRHEPLDSPLLEPLRRWLGFPSAEKLVSVYRGSDAEPIVRLPESGFLLGFSSDSRSLWAYSSDARSGWSVRRWSIASRWPPWWFFAATGLAMIFVVASNASAKRR